MQHDDRRESPRVQLDVPVFCTLMTDEGREYPCMVRNISATGLMGELPPTGDAEVEPGSAGLLHNCPEFLAEYCHGVRCSVVWRSGTLFGARFMDPPSISSARLGEILEALGFEA